MNPEYTPEHKPGSDPSSDARDLLISRVIDGEASPEDWQALRVLASDDQRIWQDLAESQQDDDQLAAELEAALSVADRADIPERELHAHGFGAGLNHRFRAAVAWSGWAIAAGLTVIATLGGIELTNSSAGGVQAGFYPVETPGDALDLYLEKGAQSGEVVAEMPAKILIEARPNPGGEGFEVLYYRQILERRIVPDMLELEGAGVSTDAGAVMDQQTPTEPVEQVPALGPDEI